MQALTMIFTGSCDVGKVFTAMKNKGKISNCKKKKKRKKWTFMPLFKLLKIYDY